MINSRLFFVFTSKYRYYINTLMVYQKCLLFGAWHFLCDFSHGGGGGGLGGIDILLGGQLLGQVFGHGHIAGLHAWGPPSLLAHLPKSMSR